MASAFGINIVSFGTIDLLQIQRYETAVQKEKNRRKDFFKKRNVSGTCLIFWRSLLLKNCLPQFLCVIKASEIKYSKISSK